MAKVHMLSPPIPQFLTSLSFSEYLAREFNLKRDRVYDFSHLLLGRFVSGKLIERESIN